MVPFSTKPAAALEIVAGLDLNAGSLTVAQDSILGRCREEGVRLHVFGLNSQEWMRWWIRLGVDSFDRSKLSTEGARNGWYWMRWTDHMAGRITVRLNQRLLGICIRAST